jgi:hypothetical protein
MHTFESERRVERRRATPENLLAGLNQMSEVINEEFKSKIGTNLLLEDGSVNMNAYEKGKKNGPFRKTIDPRNSGEREFGTIKYDKETVTTLESRFALKRFPSESEESAVKKYRRERRQGSWAQLEMALTLVFHKILSEEFLVVRASQYDDYMNGVDYLIINRKTGNVACSFDGFNSKAGDLKHAEKMYKTIDKAKKGGAKVKYGISFEKNQDVQEIARKPVEHVVPFNISLNDDDELQDLLAGMETNITGAVTPIEKKVFETVMKSLQEQQEILAKEDLPEDMKTELNSFKTSFEQMQKLGRK